MPLVVVLIGQSEGIDRQEDYSHPDDHNRQTTDTYRFKPFTIFCHNQIIRLYLTETTYCLHVHHMKMSENVNVVLDNTLV